MSTAPSSLTDENNNNGYNSPDRASLRSQGGEEKKSPFVSSSSNKRKSPRFSSGTSIVLASSRSNTSNEPRNTLSAQLSHTNFLKSTASLVNSFSLLLLLLLLSSFSLLPSFSPSQMRGLARTVADNDHIGAQQLVNSLTAEVLKQAKVFNDLREDVRNFTQQIAELETQLVLFTTGLALLFLFFSLASLLSLRLGFLFHSFRFFSLSPGDDASMHKCELLDARLKELKMQENTTQIKISETVENRRNYEQNIANLKVPLSPSFSFPSSSSSPLIPCISFSPSLCLSSGGVL
jgi:hypothetical protein